jgi:hypothetical protein
MRDTTSAPATWGFLDGQLVPCSFSVGHLKLLDKIVPIQSQTLVKEMGTTLMTLVNPNRRGEDTLLVQYLEYLSGNVSSKVAGLRLTES